ncbi:phosphate-selective porin, OprO/OprP family [gamma proteobacterium NOR5-3]|nr:phosphate-selective porin, OprO/OprP family [gamma proteobacterium NOR5-3]
MLALIGAGSVAAGESLLLRNVLLPSMTGGDDKNVSILITNHRLELISEDPIPVSDDCEVFDAKGGFVIGRLDLGAPAGFLILEGDPRDDPELLLDTRRNASFGAARGEILKNTLPSISDTERGVTSYDGWLAYTPPPLALPLDYRDATRWNHFQGRHVSGVLAGLVGLDRTAWLAQNAESQRQVGDLDSLDGGTIRALRAGGVGTLNFDNPWVWTVFGTTHAFERGFDSGDDDDFSWIDLRLDIPVWKDMTVSVGKQKEPISMERLMSLLYLPQQERSASADSLLRARNVGAVFSTPVFDDRAALAVGVFNDWLDKGQPSSPGDNTTTVVGRATFVPWTSPDENTLLHVGFGYRSSNGKEPAALRARPEVNSAPDFVISDQLRHPELDTYQAELSLRSGPVWIHGEWIDVQIDSGSAQQPNPSGYNVTASWILTGERRPYNSRAGVFGRAPVARGVDVNGWGTWEMSTRYSKLKGNTFMLDAGDMNIWSAGLNWWLTPRVSFNVNYRWIDLTQDSLTGKSEEITARLMVIVD